jgi:N-acylglucosamine 2-epimerase
MAASSEYPRRSPKPDLDVLRPFVEKYRANLTQSVIPFWLRHSIDHTYGGFFTCLDRRGTIFDDRKYVWLQGRAVWMFAKLYNDYDSNAEYLTAARDGLDFLRRFGRDADGRSYFSLTRNGVGFATQRKPFGLAFHTLGSLEYARAVRDDALLTEAEQMFELYISSVDDPALVGRSPLPGQVRATSLPEQLMLLTMALQFSKLRPGAYVDVIATSIETIRRHYDEERMVLLDHAFVDDPPSVWPEHRLLNPGHAVETSWLLLDAAAVTCDEASVELALNVLRSSLRAAWDPVYGGLFYLVDVAGRPPLQIEASMKLWWTHAEAMLALVKAYAWTGSHEWIRWLHLVDQYTFEHFVDDVNGEWFGYLNRSGQVANECKGGPYKGFYHVPRALLLSVLCYEQLREPGR